MHNSAWSKVLLKTSKLPVAYEVGFWDGKLHNQKLLQYFDCHGRGATQITSWKNLKNKVTKRHKMRFSFACPASGRLLNEIYDETHLVSNELKEHASA